LIRLNALFFDFHFVSRYEAARSTTAVSGQAAAQIVAVRRSAPDHRNVRGRSESDYQEASAQAQLMNCIIAVAPAVSGTKQTRCGGLRMSALGV
jgi:hypothetical protein